MLRQPRLDAPGALHHIRGRGAATGPKRGRSTDVGKEDRDGRGDRRIEISFRGGKERGGEGAEDILAVNFP